MELRLYLAVLGFSLFIGCSELAKTSTRPNILFAIADDASWKHFGAYGCDWVKTPGFDYVAENGILFMNAYTPNAKCAPSRACILTGRNSWQLEEAANHFPYFPSKYKTYVEALGAHGYWTGSVAKGWSPGEALDAQGNPRQLTGPKFDDIKLKPPTTGIGSHDYAQNFSQFINEKPDGQPFCFWYGGYEPHRAYEYETGVKLAGKTLQMIDEVPAFWPDVDSVRNDMLDYAYEIEYFDSHLVKMIDLLKANGELENTIIVVTADNGMPFPRVKGQVYEYSNHLPLAIMWPNGIVESGRKEEAYANFIDFAPTFFEVAGIDPASAEMAPITGKSLTDFFNNNVDEEERDFVLVGKERHDIGRPDDVGYPVRGIIKDSFLYLHNFKTDRWPVGNPETGYLNCDGSPTKSYILNTRRVEDNEHYWSMNFGKRDEEELYNIKLDPYCMDNLADLQERETLRNTLKAEMMEKLIEQGDPRVLGNGEVFDQYEYAGSHQGFYARYMSGEQMNTSWVNDSDFEKSSIVE
ncbi:sulfatase family protein [Portibacter marinus]|uniref:sulfatase family protein n=1 Tax=Portibacter marinus TaxID=2898660 RepID=UPI001F16BF89|nr:sulfatase-like hydrolase/transferase [Portibacter marinus]